MRNVTFPSFFFRLSVVKSSAKVIKFMGHKSRTRLSNCLCGVRYKYALSTYFLPHKYDGLR